jgi:hypothetical protein
MVGQIAVGLFQHLSAVFVIIVCGQSAENTASNCSSVVCLLLRMCLLSHYQAVAIFVSHVTICGV